MLPKKKGNIFKRQEQSTDNFNNLESELLDPLEEPLLELLEELLEKSSSSTENIRWSGQARAPWVLYPGQVSYDSSPISS